MSKYFVTATILYLAIGTDAALEEVHLHAGLHAHAPSPSKLDR